MVKMDALFLSRSHFLLFNERLKCVYGSLTYTSFSNKLFYEELQTYRALLMLLV